MSWNCRECGAFEGQLHVQGCPLSDTDDRTRLLVETTVRCGGCGSQVLSGVCGVCAADRKYEAVVASATAETAVSQLRAVAAVASVEHSGASPLLKHVPHCGFKDCTRPSCPESTTDYGLLCPRGYCAIHYEQWKMVERPAEHGPYGDVRDAPGKTLENYLAQRINKLAVDDMSEPP